MPREYRWTKGATLPEVRIIIRLTEEYGELDPEACWIWPGATRGRTPHLYGAIKVGSRQDGTRRTAITHIVMYEAVHGPVPEGLELDHLCQVKLCCNPAHLEPVTHRINLDRKPPELVEKQVRAMLAARGIPR